MRRVIFWLGLWVLFSTFCWAKLEFSEAMYAPREGPEWIELYNPSLVSLNLSAWSLADKKDQDNFACCGSENCSLILEPGKYAVITGRKEVLNYSDADALRICVDDLSLGNGMGNTGDEFTLSNGTAKYFFSYTQDSGAYLNNYTLERREDGSWGESIILYGTPGRKNSIFDLSIDFEPLYISEVMPDPFDKDDDLKPWGEWVELHNSGKKTIYLSGLVLKDKDDDHELYISEDKIYNENGILIPPNNYTVIYRDGDSDFSLNNDGYDEVRLFFGDQLIDFMSYSGSTEGMSWSNSEEGDWYITPPTPERKNRFSINCDWFLRLNTNNSIFFGDDFSFNLSVVRDYGLPQEITVRGQIENVNGKVIKSYVPWTKEAIISFSTIKYSPNLPEGFYQLVFWIENLSCNDEDTSDNQITRIIAINPEYRRFSSLLQFEQLYLGSDERAKWGDLITAKVKVHKGNESATSVELWAEKNGRKISGTTRLNVPGSFEQYILTLPVQLAPNCKEDFSDGQATLVLEGLGQKAEASFEVRDLDKNLCEEFIVAKETKSSSSYHLSEWPSRMTASETSSIKVQIFNDEVEHKYTLWGYLYRGGKCYSCANSTLNREDSAQHVYLQANEAKIVEIPLVPDKNLEGEFKLKVKIQKDQQKTPAEFTQNLVVAAPQLAMPALPPASCIKEEKEESNSCLREEDFPETKRSGSGNFLVYQSSSKKAKKILPYLLLTAFGLLLVVVLGRK